ncbi:hypothetical protein FRC12_018289 [Ceratobasidium sp. 428]|nr:hypothetical protein FRC12_018289 [Ceratobasidium sp. 428]
MAYGLSISTKSLPSGPRACYHQLPAVYLTCGIADSSASSTKTQVSNGQAGTPPLCFVSGRGSAYPLCPNLRAPSPNPKYNKDPIRNKGRRLGMLAQPLEIYLPHTKSPNPEQPKAFASRFSKSQSAPLTPDLSPTLRSANQPCQATVDAGRRSSNPGRALNDDHIRYLDLDLDHKSRPVCSGSLASRDDSHATSINTLPMHTHTRFNTNGTNRAKVLRRLSVIMSLIITARELMKLMSMVYVLTGINDTSYWAIWGSIATIGAITIDR